MGAKVGQSEFLTSMNAKVDKKEAKRRQLSVCGHDVMKVAKIVISNSKVWIDSFSTTRCI